jgi:ABC-type nitrate/sulfonate/bicarbonate transport system substrate-binding protein
MGASVWEDEMKRRIATLCVALLASLVVGAGMTVHARDKITVVVPQNSIFVLSWMGAKDGGVFEKHGIDLEVDARPFAGFLASLPAKQCMVTTYAGTEAILKMNQGLDWVVIGGGLTVFQRVYVKKDSPIKSVADLRGKRFGVWSTGAGSFKATQAAMIDAHGVDVTKDAELVQVAAPALFKLLEQGKVDAMFNLSSFTIRAASQPDQFREIFSTNEYWKKKAGYPVLWSAPLVAWRSWVEEDRDRAKRFAAATADSYRWLAKPENLEAAVKKYGQLAGVTTPDAIATYKKWLGQQEIFLPEWNQKVADAQWQFLEMAKRQGVIDEVPPKNKHVMVLGN